MTDYFGQPACLAQSPQLYKQMAAACGGFERVMEVRMTWKAFLGRDVGARRVGRGGGSLWYPLRCVSLTSFVAEPERVGSCLCFCLFGEKRDLLCLFFEMQS